MISSAMKHCTLCPRQCGADRNTGHGFCGEGRTVRIARAALHHWEEPCISGTRGSGTVFFSGCVLRCVFCQNHEISHEGKGYAVTENELAECFLRLKAQGAHNINLVNPTHFVPQIMAAIGLCGDIGIPFVYNSGGYEKPETLEMLRGRVSIFLPDLKYYSSELSKKYSSAADYYERTMAAIGKMYDIAGKPVFGEDGIMRSGVIVRHLILPNSRHDSIALIEKLRERFAPDEIMVSLMCQYTPVYRAHEFKELSRRLSGFEYKTVAEALEKAGFEGFMQERGSASEDFIPEFYDKPRPDNYINPRK
ncbi:MAG: radical SAM protein [Ruminococcus sp.]|nr:radical SAM protein [Ruminococcus sp.]